MLVDTYSGDKLRRLRKRARLTQRQVVKLAGVSEAAICYLEQGKRKPQQTTLDKLLNLYAIKIQYWKNIDTILQEENPNV